MKDPFLFHSVLTPMMNIGLLTDTEVLKIVLQYQEKIPIQSFEGFIRQLIGWRNYVYTIYLLTDIENTNFFNHTNKLNKEIMWKAETKLLPIDNIINKIVDYSYCHHIERLMYLGNYMLLCMIDPKDVYTIFMEWTIDAYDWVMVANVYGMSQFSCGDLMMKKPYFSSSNYILKMSDYKKDNWCKIWDALYYNFINKHEKYLKTNYGTSRQVYHWNRKLDKEKKEILKIANQYLDSI
jgi:deoxyribodipyrimidine photolyase-related protein